MGDDLRNEQEQRERFERGEAAYEARGKFHNARLEDRAEGACNLILNFTTADGAPWFVGMHFDRRMSPDEVAQILRSTAQIARVGPKGAA